MNWDFTPYALPLFIGAAVSAIVAIFAWLRRPAAGATCLFILALGAAEWSFMYGVALGFTDLSVRIFLAKMQHLGIAVIMPSLFVLVLRYTGLDEYLTRLNVVLVSSIPFVDVVLAWTNGQHGLIWSDINLTIQKSVPILQIDYGAYFWLLAFYSYAVLIFITFLLLRSLLLSSGLQRQQSAVMLAAVAFPWLGSMIYLLGWVSSPRLDFTPFGYSIAGIVMGLGLFRYRLLDIVPVARDIVVESMGEGVIVLDTHNRIADLNVAAQRLAGHSYEESIGKTIDQVFSDWPSLVEPNGTIEEKRGEVMVFDGERRFDYRVHASTLTARNGRINGRLILLHDISEEKKSEEELKESYNKIRALSASLVDAREKERKRFALEIHDELGQALTALKFDLSSLKEDLSRDGEDPVERIDTMTKLIDTTLKAVKRISSELRPALLDLMGLGSAIEQQGKDFESRTGIECSVNLDPEEIELDEDLSTTVFRIFQEALTNVARHSEATKVDIDLVATSDKITLRVTDNGRGITSEQISSPESFGLLSMRERLTPWGGDISFAGKKNEGTVVEVVVPLGDQDNGRD